MRIYKRHGRNEKKKKKRNSCRDEGEDDEI
jgi:hypothetical protein